MSSARLQSRRPVRPTRSGRTPEAGTEAAREAQRRSVVWRTALSETTTVVSSTTASSRSSSSFHRPASSASSANWSTWARVAQADPEAFALLTERYGLKMQPETVPELLERFALRMDEPLSGGWTP
jgi:hypothetical protein